MLTKTILYKNESENIDIIYNNIVSAFEEINDYKIKKFYFTDISESDSLDEVIDCVEQILDYLKYKKSEIN